MACEAKREGYIEAGMGQSLGYLACVRKCGKGLLRVDLAVYVWHCTDGYLYEFSDIDFGGGV